MHYYELRKEAHESWKYCIIDELIYLPDAVAVLNKTRSVVATESYPEIYLKGHVWIEAEFVLLGKRHANYTAIIESVNTKIKPSIDNYSSARKRLQSKNVASGDLRESAVNLAPVRGNSAMFVEIAHGVEPPKRMRFISVPSVIRLQCQDFSSGSLGNSISLIPKSFSVGTVVDFHDGKLGALRIDNSADPLRQTPNELVEAGSHVVERVADSQADVVGNIEQLYFGDIPSLFKIVIVSDRICFFSGERFEERIKSIQMRLRPTNLQVGINQTSA